MPRAQTTAAMPASQGPAALEELLASCLQKRPFVTSQTVETRARELVPFFATPAPAPQKDKRCEAVGLRRCLLTCLPAGQLSAGALRRRPRRTEEAQGQAGMSAPRPVCFAGPGFSSAPLPHQLPTPKMLLAARG